MSYMPSGHNEQYDALPESIKNLYTPEQWSWLSDLEKATLERRECEPEYDQ